MAGASRRLYLARLNPIDGQFPGYMELDQRAASRAGSKGRAARRRVRQVKQLLLERLTLFERIRRRGRTCATGLPIAVIPTPSF
jgi:hypothetical protein